jgi:Protein of unknown function (DUF2914)
LDGVVSADMRENKVVIKINYDPIKQQKAIIDPKSVTVWHVHRIAGALVLLVLLAAGLFYSLSDNSHNDEKFAAQVAALDTSSKVDIGSEGKVSVEAKDGLLDKPLPKIDIPAVIYDKRVIHAALYSSFKAGVPGAILPSVIHLDVKSAYPVYYFSQVKQSLQSQALYHQWFKNGRSVIKKRLVFERSNGKLMSERIISDKDIGLWRVVLVNEKGKLLSELNFAVVQ